jgi:MFS family permease
MSQRIPDAAEPVRAPSVGGGPLARPTVLLLAATAVSCVAVLLPAPQPLRAIGGIALIGFLPGAAIAGRLLPPERLLRVVVAVALSLAITVGASLALFYAQQWSWRRCVLIAAAVAVAAVVPDPRRWRWPWRRSVS